MMDSYHNICVFCNILTVMQGRYFGPLSRVYILIQNVTEYKKCLLAEDSLNKTFL